MRHLVGGPWVIGRLRAVLLIAVAVAALADLTTYVALEARGDTRTTPPPTAAAVARDFVQAVADDDCTGLDRLLVDDAVLPPSVTACLRGVASGVQLSGARVVRSSVDGGTAAVTVAVSADGQRAEVVVELARRGSRWLVAGVRPVG